MRINPDGEYGVPGESVSPDHRISLGQDRGRGNLLGLQPHLELDDYATETRFAQRLERIFAAAAAAGWLRENTVAVLPEYLGTWLVVAGEPALARRAARMHHSMTRLALCHLPAFLHGILAAREEDRPVAALLRMKSAETVAIYQRTFSRLAAHHRISVVAGSLILPEPAVDDGVLRAGAGPLYNTAVLYAPDGRACAPPVRKIYPTALEQTFLARGSLDELPVFSTPAGRLGVLVCADAWFPAPYRRLRDLGAGLVAVPSYGMDEEMAASWPGYSGFPNPDDIDPADPGRITRAEAWRKYALEGRLHASSARAGLNVFFRGRLWQATTGAPSTALLDGETRLGPRDNTSALLNIWL